MSLPPDRPIRYLITAGEATPRAFQEDKAQIVDTVQAAVRSGIELVQVREKSLHAAQLLDLVALCVAAAKGFATKVLINERFDIALASGADGVNLPAKSLPVEVVRANTPEGFLIGVSTHSLDEVLRARDSGADLALFGPVFTTPGKGKPTGVKTLRDVCAAAAPFPVLALGGIDGSNVSTVLQHGAAGYAAIRYLNEFVKISK